MKWQIFQKALLSKYVYLNTNELTEITKAISIDHYKQHYFAPTKPFLSLAALP